MKKLRVSWRESKELIRLTKLIRLGRVIKTFSFFLYQLRVRGTKEKNSKYAIRTKTTTTAYCLLLPALLLHDFLIMRQQSFFCHSFYHYPKRIADIIIKKLRRILFLFASVISCGFQYRVVRRSLFSLRGSNRS